MLIYTASADSGIQVATFDPVSGEISAARLAAAANCLFMIAHPSQPVIYTVEAKERRVSAYRVLTGGNLELLNQVDAGGAVPCHLAIDSNGQYLVVANYNGGVALFELDPTGRISEVKDHHLLEGRGPDKRQEKSHPHGVVLSPDEEVLYVPDLGTDRVEALRVDTTEWKLVPDSTRSGHVEPGSGPRHLAFAPQGDLAVAVNELSNTLSLFTWKEKREGLGNGVAYPMLPNDWEGTTWAAEIEFHPSGQHCYASNRGEHSIVVYPVSREPLGLGEPSWVKDTGTDPQHHLTDEEGRWLLVAFRTSDEVAVYPLAAEDGRVLGGRVFSFSVSKPMCVLLTEYGTR